jgi:hypothetical protein
MLCNGEMSYGRAVKAGYVRFWSGEFRYYVAVKVRCIKVWFAGLGSEW